MPRACTICTHAEREAIDRALVAGDPAPRIAALHRVSEDAVARHRGAHLAALLARAVVQEGAHANALQAQSAGQQARVDAHAADVMAELRRCFERVNLVFDACDRWLRDPEDPTRYDVGPRADDVQVVYLEPGPNGLPIRHKAPLSRLLARLEDAGVDVDRGETKHADPRELVLKTAAQLEGQITLLAKLIGELDERPRINLLVAPEWHAVRGELLLALAPFPEARLAVAARLASLEGSANGHRG